MKTTWVELYKKEIKKIGHYDEYLKVKIKEKTPLIKRIIKHAKPRKRILEAACGTAVLSTYLTNLGFNVTAVDIDKEILKLANKISKNYLHKPSFKKGNLFSLNYPDNYFDVVFSHGVLEHFSDKDIIKILNIELRISKTVIVSIPSNYFKKSERMFGDERFLSRNKWVNLINRTPADIIEIFEFHYLMGWQKIWDLFSRMKLFGTAPYLTFVLQKK